MPAPAARAAGTDGTSNKPDLITGSAAILRSLAHLGVKDVFGIPGGAVIPFYDELMAQDAIRHILVRHEQGAGHSQEMQRALSTTDVGKGLVLGLAVAFMGLMVDHLVLRWSQDRKAALGLG